MPQWPGLTGLLSENAPKCMKDHEMKTVRSKMILDQLCAADFVTFSYLEERSLLMRPCLFTSSLSLLDNKTVKC